MPPALTQGDGDAFEGLSVLDEGRGELGLVLWQSLRDATLWGCADPAERSALFSPATDTSRAPILAAGVPAKIEAPLGVLMGLVEHPDSVREEDVALACRELAGWAEAGGLLSTALAFCQAAALVRPADPKDAYNVGRMARRRAEHSRAETWFRRAIVLARQAGDRRTYVLALVGIGNLYIARGNHSAGWHFLDRAAAEDPEVREAMARTLREAERSADDLVRSLRRLP